MVAKVICEITEGLEEDFEPARMLYTGTTTKYFCNSLHLFEEFRHPGKDIYLSENIWTPTGYAVKRAKIYGDSPLLLVVDSQKLNYELYYNGTYRTKGLPPDSFLPYPISPDPQGKLTAHDCESIDRITDLLAESSKEDIKGNTNRFSSIRS